MLFGKTEVFAIECSIAKESPRLREDAYGRFVLWVAGVAYGSLDECASNLIVPYNNMNERVSEHGSLVVPAVWALSDLDALRKVYDVVYCQDFSGPDVTRSVRLRAQYERLLLAPDASGAFDSGEIVVALEQGEAVRIIGGSLAEGPGPHSPDWATVLSSVQISRRDFYEITSSWMRWYREAHM